MNTNFQYTVLFSASQYKGLPSASQIGELPSYLAFKAFKSNNVGLSVAGYAFGFVATPISIAFTPIAIIADIVVGIAEGVFIAYKGASRKEVQELLFKKIIVCPVQQILSVTIKTILFYPGFGILWPLAYACSQFIIKALPDCLNHKRMNIFINGGITDKGRNKTCFDEENESSSQKPLRKRIAEARASMSRINNAHTPPKYAQFKQKILNQESAQNIFGFGNNPFTQDDLSKRYRELVLIVHPDKNVDFQQEAHLLFLCLQAAHCELQLVL